MITGPALYTARPLLSDTTESSSDDDFTVTQPVVPTANPNVDEASSDTVPYQESNQSHETVPFDLSDHSDGELFIPESISKRSIYILGFAKGQHDLMTMFRDTYD